MSGHNTQLLYQLINAQERMFNHLTGAIMTQLEQLRADVAAQTDVVNSAAALLQNLHAQLSAAYLKIVKEGDASDLQGIIKDIEGNTSALSAAVAANTVADPAPAAETPEA